MAKRANLQKKLLVIVAGIITLLVGVFGARLIYHKLREPAYYTPNGQPVYASPIGLIPVNQVITPKEAGTRAVLPAAKWVPQSFNNCGPATTAMVLQYFGFNVSQEETKAHLRTSADDKNVFTYEISDYLRKDYGIESKIFYGGNLQLIKKLIANGFYIVVEDFLHPNDDIGHDLILRGFDDEQGVLIADDSYFGVNITYPYTQFINGQWKPFNYEYMPVYKAGSEPLLSAIVGPAMDTTIMYKDAATKARSEIATNANDMYAWFNLGSNLYGLKDYVGAKAAFEKSRSIGWPMRMLWYQIESIYTYNALHEYQNAIDFSNLALIGNDSFAEPHLEKAIAYKGLGNISAARDEANKALLYYPNFKKAQDFISSL